MASQNLPNSLPISGSLSFRILEETDENESTDSTSITSTSTSTSPVSSVRSVKSATRPSRLFRTTSWSPDAADSDHLMDFTNSKEFAQLLTGKIKYREPSETASIGKENDDSGIVSLRKQLEDGEEFKDSGDGFKRPVPPKELQSPLNCKRVRSALGGHFNSSPSSFGSPEVSKPFMALGVRSVNSPQPVPKPNTNVSSYARLLVRSQSESAVKHAVEKSSTDPLLLGDCSQRYVLPLLSNGKHGDLKEIDSSTVVDLIEGKYASQIKSFRIIDCRYPYEFQGGHIKGALNLYTQQQVNSTFMENKTAKAIGDVELERNIIIFHCEFSSQRAPSLCRYLRSADRLCNATSFPALHYPELYILFGGYKSFFNTHEAYCEPQYYLTMLDDKHKDDLKLYKSKSVNELVASKPKSVKRFPRFTSATMVKQPNF